MRQATKDSLLELADHPPSEASKRCSNSQRVGCHGATQLSTEVGHASMVSFSRLGSRCADADFDVDENSFTHPDAQRRFRVMTNVGGARARTRLSLGKVDGLPAPRAATVGRAPTSMVRHACLDRPEPVKPSSRCTAQLSGADQPGRPRPADDLLDTLANALQTKLRRLLGNEPRLAKESKSTPSMPSDFGSTRRMSGQATIAERRGHARPDARGREGGRWPQVRPAFPAHGVGAGGRRLAAGDWEAYRDVARLGRKTRLPEAQRKVLWSIFERVRAGLKARH